ncbi:MAG: hypothetical protein AAGB04_11330 [Pseudomonadota bacterium]
MPAELTIVTEAEIRAFAEGSLGRDRAEDVAEVVAFDDRARAALLSVLVERNDCTAPEKQLGDQDD